MSIFVTLAEMAVTPTALCHIVLRSDGARKPTGCVQVFSVEQILK